MDTPTMYVVCSVGPKRATFPDRLWLVLHWAPDEDGEMRLGSVASCATWPEAVGQAAVHYWREQFIDILGADPAAAIPFG